MRTAATTWLTIIGVLWHAVVGCCAHHSHAADELLPAAAVEAHGGVDLHHGHEVASGHCCRGHHHAKDETPAAIETDGLSDHGDHPAQEPCDETACSFLGAKPTAAVEMGALIAAGLWLPTPTVLKPTIGLLSSRPAHPGDERPPRLRTHLALNVLLI